MVQTIVFGVIFVAMVTGIIAILVRLHRLRKRREAQSKEVARRLADAGFLYSTDRWYSGATEEDFTVPCAFTTQLARKEPEKPVPSLLKFKEHASLYAAFDGRECRYEFRPTAESSLPECSLEVRVVWSGMPFVPGHVYLSTQWMAHSWFRRMEKEKTFTTRGKLDAYFKRAHLAGRFKAAFRDERLLDTLEAFVDRWRGWVTSMTIYRTIELTLDLAAAIEDDDFVEEFDALRRDAFELAQHIDRAFNEIPLSMSREAPQYARITRLDTCPHCGSGLPLNGFHTSPACGSCGKAVEIGRMGWIKTLVAMAMTPEEESFSRFGYSTWFMSPPKGTTLDFHRPTCAQCGQDLPEDQLGGHEARDIPCPACGHVNTARPTPDWVARLTHEPVTMMYNARETKDDGAAVAADVDETAVKPVAFNCPQCAAGLTITAEMPRVTACAHCDASVYLPDGLWNALHPVKSTTPWYIRLDRREYTV